MSLHRGEVCGCEDVTVVRWEGGGVGGWGGRNSNDTELIQCITAHANLTIFSVPQKVQGGDDTVGTAQQITLNS